MKTLLCLFLCWLPVLSAVANTLTNHPSPYLRLHAQDAAQWQLWNAEVLQQAKKENKLIFVSIGYYSCHWCHVMRRESFMRDDIADLLNKNFVSIKVDRELNPALDDYLLKFVERTRGYSGWPLNVVLTPAGYPLLGFVYLPADDFKKIMQKLQQRWQKTPQKLLQLAQQDFESQQNKKTNQLIVSSAQEMRAALFDVVLSHADEFMGGIGDQAKFPRPALIKALLNIYTRQADTRIKDFLLTTLDNMASQGLHDVIGGGFFRYTIDPSWQVPHYEKMLYTNAAMIQVYVKAYQVFGKTAYLQVAHETLQFILNEMSLDNGAYISALSAADSSDKEGGSYIWTDAEFSRYLSEQELESIHNNWLFFQVNDEQGLLPAALATDKRWHSIKQALYKKRQQNPAQRDDKFLLSWNAYLLTSIAALQQQDPQKRYQQVGQDLYALLLKKINAGLYRRTGQNVSHYLEDYAFVIQGLMDWEQVAALSQQYHDIYKKTLRQALNLFFSGDGWRLSEQIFIPFPALPSSLLDSSLPAADVVIYRLIERLKIMPNTELSTFIKRVDAKLLSAPMDYASRIEYEFQKTKTGLPNLSNGAK